MEIKKMGLKELSKTELKDINGGADYIWYGGGNPLVYAGVAFYNGGVTVYNWITGSSAGCRYI